MKALLVAINAKYIHSNLGIYSLKAYGERQPALCESGSCIELAEYTINHQLETILQDIYRRQPDFIGFSCYIWNITYVKMLLADLKKVLPQVEIWLGGPEVSYDGPRVLRENPAVTGIMKGEGEETFAQLLSFYVDKTRENAADGGKLSAIPGLVLRGCDASSFTDTGSRPVMDMSAIPFPYAFMDMRELEHRIIYYESSRGCPFSCAYCLSSIDKQVRFRSLELVKEELAWFLAARVPQVKFVDRTFNCKKSHAMAIWQFILEHDNGATNFHFEIAADLLDEDEMLLLKAMRPGLVQLEIGVQSTNPRTLSAIRRRTDIDEIRRITTRINSWHNIHQHLDLIAGLPWENLESFKNSFNEVYAMEPEQLQLGFLKVLKGSYMEEMTADCQLRFSENPPYEVLSTRWLPYRDVLELKRIEEMVEVYYNSRQFSRTLEALTSEYGTPYEMFSDMAVFYEENALFGLSHSRLARFEFLWSIIERKLSARDACEPYRDSLMYDLYLRENAKSRPSFAREQSAWKNRLRGLFSREEENPHYLKGYEGCDSRQLAKMAHAEVMGDGRLILFDYKNRDPLTGNAKAVEVQDEEN